MSIQGLENHEELVWTNHDFLHKSEVNPPFSPLMCIKLMIINKLELNIKAHLGGDLEF